jgi:hypothetical protein
MGIVTILRVLLHLLVRDSYYVEFTTWASLPYFHYYSVYWFTTSTAWCLLNAPCSHTSSTLSIGWSSLHGACSHSSNTTPSNWFMTGTTWSFLQRHCSHTSKTTPSTGSRLVLHGVYCMDLAPILPLLLRLLVHDWYNLEFTAWSSHPYFHYYSVYSFTTSSMWSLLHGHGSHTSSSTPSNWFTTGTTWSLLHRPRSHTSITTPSTGSRLVLLGVYYIGIAPILPVLLHLIGS